MRAKKKKKSRKREDENVDAVCKRSLNMDAFDIHLKNQVTLLFNLFLLLFISFIVLFNTIHESHCIILVNFHFYLQYF